MNRVQGGSTGPLDIEMARLLATVRQLSIDALGEGAPERGVVQAPQCPAHVQQITYVLDHYLAVYRALKQGSNAPLLLAKVWIGLFCH